MRYVNVNDQLNFKKRWLVLLCVLFASQQISENKLDQQCFSLSAVLLGPGTNRVAPVSGCIAGPHRALGCLPLWAGWYSGRARPPPFEMETRSLLGIEQIAFAVRVETKVSLPASRPCNMERVWKKNLKNQNMCQLGEIKVGERNCCWVYFFCVEITLGWN